MFEKSVINTKGSLIPRSSWSEEEEKGPGTHCSYAYAQIV